MMMLRIDRTVILWNIIALVLFLALPVDFKIPAVLLCGALMLAHRALKR